MAYPGTGRGTLVCIESSRRLHRDGLKWRLAAEARRAGGEGLPQAGVRWHFGAVYFPSRREIVGIKRAAAAAVWPLRIMARNMSSNNRRIDA